MLGRRAGKSLQGRRCFQKRGGSEHGTEIAVQLLRALRDAPRGLCQQPADGGRLEMLSCLMKATFFGGFGKGAGHRCFKAPTREQDQAGDGLVHNPLRSCMHPPLKALCAAARNGKPS